MFSFGLWFFFIYFWVAFLYERAKIANDAGEEVLVKYHLYYIFNIIKKKKSVTT